MLLDKVLANRLTLLFAASGVGKSSLLQAGLIPLLQEQQGDDVVYFFQWAGDAGSELKHAIVKQLRGVLPDDHVADFSLPLAEFICRYSLFSDKLVIVLDQFEEFFHYRRLREEAEPFLRDLAAALHDPTTVFILSMREDFALELDALKPFYPALFDNFFRLERLSPQAAQEAIEKPLEPLGFRYEPDLLQQLVKHLSRREHIDRYGLEAALSLQKAPLRVEPPHLQIICSELWAADQHDTERCIRLATYTQKGGAEQILDSFFQVRMDTLSPKEQHLAASAFDLLVNKHGTKMSYPLPELADKLRVDEQVLGAVLDKLAKIWVLRKYTRQNSTALPENQAATATSSQHSVSWFELYHDVFARIAYAWNEAHKARQRRKRLFIAVAGALVLGVSSLLAFLQRALGAWTGLGFYAKASTVEALVKRFHAAHADQPFYRQALYRAIDNSLITLEVKGDEEDLARLEALWQQERVGQEQKTGPAWAIPARLEWTVARMQER